MLLWPLHTHTSPNMKSARVMVLPPDVTFRLCLSKLGWVVGRSTRHVVCAPVAWSGPTVAWIVSPRNTTSTAAPSSENPHTTACLGAAARTMPSPTAAAKRKGTAGAIGPGRVGSQSCITPASFASQGEAEKLSAAAPMSSSMAKFRGEGGRFQRTTQGDGLQRVRTPRATRGEGSTLPLATSPARSTQALSTNLPSLI